MTITACVKQQTPRDFVRYRSRWWCATIAIVLVEKHNVTARVETIHRGLQAARLAWHRPRLVVGLENQVDRQKLVADSA